MRVYIGYDPREEMAWRVAAASLEAHSTVGLEIIPLELELLRERGLYKRPTRERPNGELVDLISDTPMSTEFSLSRFLVPALMGYEGWAMFVDCDFMFRADVAELLALRDDRYAVMCVQRHYLPQPGQKMDGREQKIYPRKNWSSLMLWNCSHPANRALTIAAFNALEYRFLHGLQWLKTEEIGSLPLEWNWIEMEPKAVHFSAGTPVMQGYERAAYADEWRAMASVITSAQMQAPMITP